MRAVSDLQFKSDVRHWPACGIDFSPVVNERCPECVRVRSWQSSLMRNPTHHQLYPIVRQPEQRTHDVVRTDVSLEHQPGGRIEHTPAGAHLASGVPLDRAQMHKAGMRCAGVQVGQRRVKFDVFDLRCGNLESPCACRLRPNLSHVIDILSRMI